MDHGEHCDCGTCRLQRGLCPRCGREAQGKSMSWGKNCDLAYVNEQRISRGMTPMTMAEYEKMDL